MKKSIFAILTAAAMTAAFAQTPTPVPATPETKTAPKTKKHAKKAKKSEKTATTGTSAAPVQK